MNSCSVLSDPSAVYIHIPFCRKKCSYCDFFSTTDLGLIPEYLAALKQEIQMVSPPSVPVSSLYFGGGTPSLLSADDIDDILSVIRKRFLLSDTCEITLEANPGTVNTARFTGYRSAGVNRLSIGVQSFNNEKLKFLRRIHTAQEAFSSITNAQKAGFENIGLDLIFGLPSETESIWQNDLEKAVSIFPSHLSCYMLTVEPGTRLWDQVENNRFSALSDEKRSDLFRQTSIALTRAGYDHYEISNFAQGMENRSRHNSTYWQNRAYQGFGASAHFFEGRVRSWNHADIHTYIRDIRAGNRPVEGCETLTVKQQILEMILLGLRTSDGIDIPEFERRFNQSFADLFKPQIDVVLENQFAVLNPRSFVLTLDGRQRINSIVEAFAGQVL